MGGEHVWVYSDLRRAPFVQELLEGFLELGIERGIWLLIPTKQWILIFRILWALQINVDISVRLLILLLFHVKFY